MCQIKSPRAPKYIRIFLKMVKILKQTKDQLFSLDGLYFYSGIVFKYLKCKMVKCKKLVLHFISAFQR